MELAKAEVPPEELHEVQAVLVNPSAEGLSPDVTADIEIEAAQSEEKQLDMRTQLGKMSMAQRLKAAMFGNAIVRKILILDPSRIIQECVLSNPKLGANELEDFVRNPNMNGQLLRSISSKSTWMRSYKIKANLVGNPKCPPDLSLKWLRFLHDNEVKVLARSKNIPQVVQAAAKKRLQEKK